LSALCPKCFGYCIPLFVYEYFPEIVLNIYYT
jgi:hypothetical protein